MRRKEKKCGRTAEKQLALEGRLTREERRRKVEDRKRRKKRRGDSPMYS